MFIKAIRPLLRLLGHQDWLRFGFRDRIIRLVETSESAGDERFLIDFFGYRYEGWFNHFVDWTAYYFGAYEKFELFLIRDLLEAMPDSRVLDIGGNVGHHSLYMSSYASIIHAFEPYPVAAERFQSKIELNNLSNVHLHPVGLGEQDETLLFTPPNDGNLGTGSFSNDKLLSNERIPLEVKQGDKYLGQLGVDRVDFIKIDVEGHEGHVLNGLCETIEKYKPVIFLEFCEKTPEKISSLGDVFKSYQAYHYSVDRPVGMFFNSPHYRIGPGQGVMHYGNLLLIPSERHDSLKSIVS